MFHNFSFEFQNEINAIYALRVASNSDYKYIFLSNHILLLTTRCHYDILINQICYRFVLFKLAGSVVGLHTCTANNRRVILSCG